MDPTDRGRGRPQLALDDSAVGALAKHDVGRRSPEVSFRLELDGRPTPPGNVSPSTLSPAGGLAAPMQKCLSFPRIVTERAGSCSVSPGQSRLYLDACFPVGFIGNGERVIDPDRLSIAGHAGLLRSMSARTVDSRQEVDPSLNSSGSSSRFLSPACDRVSACALAGRSTSCPSMAYPNLTCRTSGLPAGASADIKYFPFRDQEDAEEEEEDINLEGEVITDLPIEPNTVFPDLPDDLVLRDMKDPNKLLEKTGKADCVVEGPQSGSQPARRPDIMNAEEKRYGARPKQDRHGGDAAKVGPFMNIRDLPRSATKDVMKQQSRPEDSYKVDTNEKCLRWLNTLPGHQS